MFPSPLSLKQFTTFISASCLAVSPFLFNTVFLIMLQCVSHLLFVFSPVCIWNIFLLCLFSSSQVWHARQGHLTLKMKSCGVIASSLSCLLKRASSESITPSSTTPLKSPHLPAVSKSRRRSPPWRHPTPCLLCLLPLRLCWRTAAE